MRNLAQELHLNKGIGPGFHFLRHALALAILVYHSYVFTYFGHGMTHLKGHLLENARELSNREFVVELLRPGLYALVGAFFILSGFLVAGSARRTRNASQFLWFRTLRIVPALAVEVTLSALLLGALFTQHTLANYFTDQAFFKYFLNIFGIVSFKLPGVFTENPLPQVVNPNLWTLPAEFRCYAIMLGLIAFGVISERKKFGSLFLLVILILILAGLLMPSACVSRRGTFCFTDWFIVYLFFVGIMFYVYADKIVLNAKMFLVCGIAYFVLVIINQFICDIFAGIFLAYCVVYMGMTRYSFFERHVKGDYSYGIYLYGAPITQAIIAVVHPILGIMDTPANVAFITVISVITTIGFSYGSWELVERHALRLKKLGRSDFSCNNAATDSKLATRFLDQRTAGWQMHRHDLPDVTRVDPA
jgi:peptidoglycan/LPS O-acetylase OafA/YrhL